MNDDPESPVHACHRMLWRRLGSVILLTAAGHASATLVSADLDAPGDGLLTLDTTTGLKWLDLTQTEGDQVTATLPGFKVASVGDVLTLWADAGLCVPTADSYCDTTLSQERAFNALIGAAFSNGSAGLVADGNEVAVLSVVEITTNYPFYIPQYGSDYYFDEAPFLNNGGYGVYAYQVNTPPAAAAIPEPESLLLLSLGFGALVLMRRKTRDADSHHGLACGATAA